VRHVANEKRPAPLVARAGLEFGGRLSAGPELEPPRMPSRPPPPTPAPSRINWVTGSALALFTRYYCRGSRQRRVDADLAKISDCCMPAAPYRGPAIKPGAACSNSVAIYVAIFRKQHKASFSDGANPNDVSASPSGGASRPDAAPFRASDSPSRRGW
jgi:hypothetical protein